MNARLAPGAGPAEVDAALLGHGEEHGLGAFLASRGAQSHLVSSRALRESLPADPTGAFTWSAGLAEVPATARTIHVDSADAELALWQEAGARFPGCRVLGLRHHLLPMLSTDRQPLKQVPAGWRADELRRYVIACPARSGSTLLGQLLTQAGLGRPKEHLRNGLAAALRSPGVDRTEAWRQVAWRAQVDGIFGSKLVAEFLLAAAGSGTVGERLAELAPEGVRVVALRRPLLETAVSRFVARGADQWHVRGAMSTAERARFATTHYDFKALHALLARNRAENLALESALARIPPARVFNVDYAELDARPIRTLEAVAAFLGETPELPGIRLDKLPIKISGQVDTHARLAERFLDDLRAHGESLEA